MKKTLAVALLVFVLFSCSQDKEPQKQTSSPGSPGQPIQSGSQREEMLFRDALAKDPKNVRAWISLGNILMDSRRLGEAVEAYTKALELDPKNVDVRVDRGTCLKYSGKPDLAIADYKKALEINPNHVNAYVNMGVTLAEDMKDYKGAVQAYEKALSLNPNFPNADKFRQEIERLKKMG